VPSSPALGRATCQSRGAPRLRIRPPRRTPIPTFPLAGGRRTISEAEVLREAEALPPRHDDAPRRCATERGWLSTSSHNTTHAALPIARSADPNPGTGSTAGGSTASDAPPHARGRVRAAAGLRRFSTRP
jgi:hypothetical protein